MAKSSKIVSLIKEIVRQEVKKEVREIFIKEGMKSMAKQSTIVEDVVVEVLPERKVKHLIVQRWLRLWDMVM